MQNDSVSTDKQKELSAAIEAKLQNADAQLAQNNWSEAKEDYEQALQLICGEFSAYRAHANAGLAEVFVAADDMPRALSHLEQAILDDPTSEGAVRRGLDLTVQMKRYAMSMELRRRLLTFAIDPDEQTAHYRAMVSDAMGLAIQALQALQGKRLEGFDVLQRLRGTYEAAGDSSRAIDVMVMQAEAHAEPTRRAEAMVQAADYCAQRTGNTSRAVALYEAAIADNPAVRGAFEAIERVLVERKDWQPLEKAYIRQAQRLEQAGAHTELGELLGRLATVRHDQLRDLQGAIEALAKRVELDPSNVQARSLLSVLLERAGDAPSACRVLEASAWHAPVHTSTYHELFRLYSLQKQHERAFQAAAALVHLGDADLDEQLLYQQFRPESGLQPTQSLQPQDWAALYPSDHDANIRKLLELIAPTAIAHRIAELEKAQKLTELPTKNRQDPTKTTISAVRSLVWGAKVLQIPLPEIYVIPDLAGGICPVPTRTPVIFVGKAVLTGRSIAELAFLVGRDLTYFMPEHRVFMYYPSQADITRLVTTVAVLAKTSDGNAATVRDPGLAMAFRDMNDATWQQVREVVARIDQTGGKIDIRGYVRSLEIAATRVGLLLSGDLPTAGALLSTDVRETAGMRAADRMRDLLPFSIGNAYNEVRNQLGISV